MAKRFDDAANIAVSRRRHNVNSRIETGVNQLPEGIRDPFLGNMSPAIPKDVNRQLINDVPGEPNPLRDDLKVAGKSSAGF